VACSRKALGCLAKASHKDHHGGSYKAGPSSERGTLARPAGPWQRRSGLGRLTSSSSSSQPSPAVLSEAVFAPAALRQLGANKSPGGEVQEATLAQVGTEAPCGLAGIPSSCSPQLS
jgi:hypothetical protein